MQQKNKINDYLWYAGDYSGCGYLRTIFPNEVLNSAYGDSKSYRGLVSSMFIGDLNILSQVKAIHFQRQIEPNQVNYMREIRNLKDKGIVKATLFYDLDDNLFDIPEYNYAHDVIVKPGHHERFKKALKDAMDIVDVFTVSTTYLKGALHNLHPHHKCEFKVVPNLIPKFLYEKEAPKIENDKPKIVWAGSRTHFKDETNMLGDLEPIAELILNTKDEFDWAFIGGCPEQFRKLGAKFNKWFNIYNYPKGLRATNADFGVAPLQDNEFNRCKSNIKLLEYSASQMVTLASKVGPYKKESSLFISEDWKENRDMIIDVFSNKEKRDGILKRQNKMMEKYWLEDNIKIYEKLFKL
jgi:hypothetical protein